VDAQWIPGEVDLERPSAARIYDYLLGGSHNFEADRVLARAAVAAMPDVTVQAQANRAFLRRAVRYLAAAGVRQFLDLGSGIPTLGNVHEIAQETVPEARVVYVDIDPVAVAHSQRLLAGNDRATALHHDLRRPDRILRDDALTGLLDLDEPVAVLAVAVLHAIDDADDPGGILARLREALAPGSYLVIAHGSDSPVSAEESRRMVEISRRTPTPLTLRTAAEIRALFDGFELVPPGLVWAPLWHPDPDQLPEHPERSANLAGVGRRLP
jgi:SAM-dependent methyltransferase